jgi:hypothetical protein
MEINVSDSAEFKRLLEALADELIDAREHFRLHQNLNAAIPEYGGGVQPVSGMLVFRA